MSRARMIASLAALAFTTAMLSASAAIDPQSVAGIWMFDEGSGTVAGDSSGNGNDGTLEGNAAWIAGPFGGAVLFDGDVASFVSVPDSPSLQMEQAMTAMLWVRSDIVMVDMWGDRQVVMGKHYTEYEIGIYTAGQLHTYSWGRPNADGYDEGILLAIDGQLPSGQADWNAGEWFHIAWTLEGVHEIAYVNGVNVGEFDKATENTAPGSHALEFGRREGGSLPLTGAVDEVAVFNVALDQADIATAFEQGLGVALGATAVDAKDKLTTTWGKLKDR